MPCHQSEPGSLTQHPKCCTRIFEVELQQKGRNFCFHKAGTDVIVCWTNTDEICFFVLAAIFFLLLCWYFTCTNIHAYVAEFSAAFYKLD